MAMPRKSIRRRNRSEDWPIKLGYGEWVNRIVEVLMHKHKYTKRRAHAVIREASGAGPLDVLAGQGRSPSAVAEFLYCRSGPQPTGVRAAMERVTGPTVKIRHGVRDPNNPTRDVQTDGQFCAANSARRPTRRRRSITPFGARRAR